MNAPDIRTRLRWRTSHEEFEEIRSRWIEHSKAEDAHDLDGLIATLTPDCVYEFPWTGHRWRGHLGARAFYTELLTAFPDIKFDLQDIVIGPQGVYEYAEVTGTHSAPWLDIAPTGEKLTWFNAILFPWDPEQKLFRGEKVYGSPAAPA